MEWIFFPKRFLIAFLRTLKEQNTFSPSLLVSSHNTRYSPTASGTLQACNADPDTSSIAHL